MDSEALTRLEHLIDALIKRGLAISPIDNHTEDIKDALKLLPQLPEEKRASRLGCLFDRYLNLLMSPPYSNPRIEGDWVAAFYMLVDIIKMHQADRRHNLSLQVINQYVQTGKTDSLILPLILELEEPQRSIELHNAFDRSMNADNLSTAQQCERLLRSYGETKS